MLVKPKYITVTLNLMKTIPLCYINIYFARNSHKTQPVVFYDCFLQNKYYCDRQAVRNLLSIHKILTIQ
jgi:hypothetical protein